MNNEDIEIVYLTDDINDNKNKKKKLNFDFKKYKLLIMIGVPSFVLFTVLIVVCVFLFSKKEVVLLNVIGEKSKINTTLDLKGIFKSDNNLYDTYKINNLSKAVINDDKIYFSYSPNYCVYDDDISCEDLEKEKLICEENRKNKCEINSKDSVCKENYCEDLFKDKTCSDNKKDNENLCVNYYNIDTEYGDLVKRYVMMANLDGTDVNELRAYEKAMPIEFRYFDNNLSLYYSHSDNASYKLDFSEDKVTKVREGFQVLAYPLSNEKETILASFKEDFYTLNYYDYNNYSRPSKQMNVYYGNDEKDSMIRIDSYNKEDFYTISSYKYDKGVNRDYNGVYKNNKLFYQFRNDYEELFVGESYIYILTTTGYNIRLLKINKESGEETTPVIILKSNKKINDIKYIATGSDNLAYINIDNSVYSFNQVDDTLVKTDYSYYSIENTGSYKNYIYFYVKTREANDFYDLVLYNVVTKQEKVINNVDYFTINNDNLYTVENGDNVYELFKYPIY